MLYIGIDLGTSAVKLLLLDETGNIQFETSREYPLEFPRPGWSQQRPEDWKEAVFDALKELTANCDASKIAGIGTAGQMHGLVILDAGDNVIRPAILWNDGRTAKQVEYLNETVGRDLLSEQTANIAFAGFTAPKLLWLRENEPENFAKIAKIMLPKDYINYLLTGVHACDYSDASGMLLLDVKNKRWSTEMLSVCGISEMQMPTLFESYAPIGTVKPEIAQLLGLSERAVVCGGAGDNAAAAVGTGVVGEGGCNLSLGTSGTVFVSSKEFRLDENNALHAFCHADGGYHLMGCMLSAASCNKWLMEDIFQTTDYVGEQSGITREKLGRNHVFFLPYLMGERSPINDTNARGTFIGMTMDTTRIDLTQAVLEGVAFALRDSFEVAKKLGICLTSTKICGGGAKSALWKQILANVLNMELQSVVTEQGPGFGGAILAMVAAGEYASVQEATDRLVRVKDTVKPDPILAALYEERYRQFCAVYPSCRKLFAQLQG